MTNHFYKGEHLRIEKVLENKYAPRQFSQHKTKQRTSIVEKIHPYYPSDELIEAVNYARLLNRPLLLRGEPGCGKTKLAQAIAYDLYTEKKKEKHKALGNNYRHHYFEWFIKSTSKAVNGIYTYDHLGRLRDAQLLHSMSSKDPGYAALKKKKAENYRKFGPLGQAFLASKEGFPSVLLIDEIDKADIDFPNDLLLELDQNRSIITETNEEIVAEDPPIIIITSNDERELPNAFLRRCVFHYISFLKDELLLKILRGRAAFIREGYVKRGLFKNDDQYMQKIKDAGLGTDDVSDDYLEQLVVQFRKIRDKAEVDPNIRKLPSTSELIDWFQVVHHNLLFDPGFTIDAMDFLNKVKYPSVLFKNFDDSKIANKIALS